MAQQRKARRRKGTQASLGRALLTGAGLGLYFGLFFQPVREPNLLMPLTLGTVGALLMALLNLRRTEQRAPAAALRYGVVAWLGLTLTLFVLEARHPVYDAAGKVGVVLFTTAAGALAGYLYVRRNRGAVA